MSLSLWRGNATAVGNGQDLYLQWERAPAVRSWQSLSPLGVSFSVQGEDWSGRKAVGQHTAENSSVDKEAQLE